MRWTILGREPALWIGFVAAVLGVLVTFNIDGLSPEQAALWVAVLHAAAGVVTAILTRPIAPGAFTAAVTALAALALGYGLQVTPELVGLLNGAMLALLALVTRGEVSPAAAVDPTVMGRDNAGNRRV
jgi:hypothetical protein